MAINQANFSNNRIDHEKSAVTVELQQENSDGSQLAQSRQCGSELSSYYYKLCRWNINYSQLSIAIRILLKSYKDFAAGLLCIGQHIIHLDEYLMNYIINSC
jgi:hypothetical protein